MEDDATRKAVTKPISHPFNVPGIREPWSGRGLHLAPDETTRP